ncbi:CyP450 monooxygenase [Gloeophyllum trabeum ATCC 11539]|uniref:CyP450 monooxygenase n=1 Tax=Gloeophyllum trabeum (strain ATCC 11539 / FP-39264 / Madison 617) TaxID=670483 RepID=S7PZP3_GLOTA|nr:CyP450 monooxygenase [Gloeophyllum trabeum ATCC 11539]EPQ52933.1 CyP450 monooxygenase [Gloeophyllum trabeum ATCC 11539]
MLQATPITLFLFLASVLVYLRLRRSLPLPPGPPGLPIVGNALEIPPSHQWLKYSEWSKSYGDIMHLNALGRHLIVLDSLHVARDLLEKRSGIYSDRPKFTMISDLMGWDWAIQFMSYGPRFRQYRSSVVGQLRKQVLPRNHPIQLREARQLVRELHTSPDRCLSLIKHASGVTMMSILYGCKNDGRRDEYVRVADAATESLVIAGNVGQYLVDFVPVLKYVPEWLPGATFRRQAREWRKLCSDLINKPFGDVKQSLIEGTASPSLVEHMLQGEESRQDEDIIKATAGVLYLGGADTTLSAFYSFMLAMVLFPDVMAKAQAEIDLVTEGQRLPEFSDKAALQYCLCLVLEVFRWVPAVPLAVPHQSNEVDQYRGYVIPKGSIVFVNVWSILHDEKLYPDPSQFNPDRYMPGTEKTPQLDPREVAFGFGRRSCPGMNFAEDHLWIVFVTILSVFDIRRTKDKQGTENPLPSHDFKVSSGMVRYVYEFFTTSTSLQ